MFFVICGGSGGDTGALHNCRLLLERFGGGGEAVQVEVDVCSVAVFMQSSVSLMP